MRIAFIGSGRVGAPLADHLQQAGHTVVLAQRGDRSDSITRALARNSKLTAEPLKGAVRGAEIIFLATPYDENEGVLEGLAEELAGKVLVDCTNPVGPNLSHGLKSETSGSAAIQALVPEAKVVKAFTIYGFENFEDSSYPSYNVKPAMLFCGRDAAAKKIVAGLIEQLGWAPLDVGGLEQALHLEHMTLLWVRMVRVQGHSPHLVWAALQREHGGARR